jgi:hypothetical protein
VPNTTWSTTDKVNCTLTSGDLRAALTGTGGVRAAHAQSAGKYYWEFTYTTVQTNSLYTGISLASASLSSPTTGNAKVLRSTGGITINNIPTGSALGIIAPASKIGIAVDLSALLIWFRIAPSGNWNGSGTANPATGVGGLSISSIAGALYPVMGGQTSDVVTANFGDTAFTGAVPSGFASGFPTVAPSSGRAKVWSGSAWALKPVKVWNGSAWVTKPAKVWNGSAWV